MSATRRAHTKRQQQQSELFRTEKSECAISLLGIIIIITMSTTNNNETQTETEEQQKEKEQEEQEQETTAITTTTKFHLKTRVESGRLAFTLQFDDGDIVKGVVMKQEEKKNSLQLQQSAALRSAVARARRKGAQRFEPRFTMSLTIMQMMLAAGQGVDLQRARRNIFVPIV